MGAQADQGASTPPAGWDGILDSDESILWQGRPGTRLSFRNASVIGIAVGLFFMGFSLFWMSMAAFITTKMNNMGPLDAIFPLFGLPFFLIGFHSVIGQVLWDAFLRGRTHYTLTSRRAFIAVDHPFRGKSLTDYEITSDAPVSLVIGPPDTLWFARGPKTSSNSGADSKIGFQQIDDARAVFALMRSLQKAAS